VSLQDGLRRRRYPRGEPSRQGFMIAIHAPAPAQGVGLDWSEHDAAQAVLPLCETGTPDPVSGPAGHRPVAERRAGARGVCKARVSFDVLAETDARESPVYARTAA